MQEESKKKVIISNYFGSIAKEDINDTFKEALFLSKGATNNRIAFQASQVGMPAHLIAEYFGDLYTDSGNKLDKIIPTSHRSRYMLTAARHQAEQALKRVVNLFDTTIGRRAVENGGEAVRKAICTYKGTIVASSTENYNAFNSALLYLPSSSYSDFAHKVKAPTESQKALTTVFAKLGKDVYKKLGDKQYEVSDIVDGVADKYSVNTDFMQDFVSSAVYDIESVANMPKELSETVEFGDKVTHCGYAYRSATIYSALVLEHLQCQNRSGYGADPTRYKYSSLLYNAAYQSMNDLGVGLYPISHIVSERSPINVTKYNQLTKEIIKLNEKFQKLTNAKNNAIEPAVIRQTLVNMFNDYANSKRLYYRMFIREDRPVPTLAEKKSANKKTSKKTVTPSRTRSKMTIEKSADGHDLMSWS